MKLEMDESVLDQPKGGLDPSVWTETENGWEMTDLAKARIAKLVKWVTSRYDIPNLSVYLIGSITSNKYSNESDIDVNFCSDFLPDVADATEFGKKIKRDYLENFEPNEPEDSNIGGHPFEIYFQNNPYQCMMSVGCFDFFGQKWIVEPQIFDVGDDPVQKYYGKNRKTLNDILPDVRQTVLDAYECALLYKKSSSQDFKDRMSGRMKKLAGRGSRLFKKIRGIRGDYTAVTAADAAKMRGNEKWHTADALYKFFDAFGYMSILKELNRLSAEECADDEIADAIIEKVHLNLLEHEGSAIAGISKKIDERELDGRPVEGLSAGEDRITPIVAAFVEERVADYGLDAWDFEVQLHGSRMRGGSRADSDLDAVVHYTGYEREDDMFNCLNAEPRLEIEGIAVDINPIRDEETGDMRSYMERSDAYDAEKTRLDEGLGQKLSMAALAAMLAVPGVFAKNDLRRGMAAAARQRQSLRVNSGAMKKVMKDAAVEKQSFGGMSFANNTNMLAKTLWCEARDQYVKHGRPALNAIASVIWNRAGGEPTNFVAVVRSPLQFSEWNGYTGGWTDRTYRYFYPATEIMNSSPREGKDIWDECNRIAVKMMKKQFKSTIGNRNMIGNPKKDNKTAKETWGAECDLVIGDHTFGYQANQDGFKKIKDAKTKKEKQAKKPSEHVIKKGETLGSIARKYGITVDDILAKNRHISDPNKISIGMKIKL